MRVYMYAHVNLGAKIYIFFDICKFILRKITSLVIIVNYSTCPLCDTSIIPHSRLYKNDRFCVQAKYEK